MMFVDNIMQMRDAEEKLAEDIEHLKGNMGNDNSRFSKELEMMFGEKYNDNFERSEGVCRAKAAPMEAAQNHEYVHEPSCRVLEH